MTNIILKNFCKLLFFALLINSIGALPAFSENININNTLTRLPIGKNIFYLEDKEGKLSIKDILNKNFKKNWIKSEAENSGFGFTKSVYWIKFSIENKEKNPVEFYLEQSYPLVDNILFYTPDKTGYKTIETGDRKVFNDRPYPYLKFIFPSKIDASTANTYYMRFQTESAMNIELYLWSLKSLIPNMINETSLLLMFFAIMFIMFTYNLFIFFSLKDISYIYYILYIASFSFFILSNNGIAYMYLWPNSVWWANNNIPFFMGFINFSIIQFARHYVGTGDGDKPILKLVDNTLKVLMWIGLILSILTLLINNYRLSIILTTSLTGVSVTVGVVAIILFTFTPGPWVRPIKFFLQSFFLLLCGIMLFVLKTFAILPSLFITIYGIHIGAVLNVVLLSFALADRINIMKNDLYKLTIELKELNETLEMKVHQRTEELQNALVELETINEKLQDTNRQLEKSQRIARLDMNMAISVQASLMPKVPPKTKEWDSAFLFLPMSGVSGDLYDFYIVKNELKGLLLLDVAGHGISSGLITMIARSIFFRNFMNGAKSKINKIIENANRDLISEIQETDKYLTGILLRFKGNNIEYVNAAHTDILCKRASDGKVSPISSKDTDFKGMPLGMKSAEHSYKHMKIKIAEGDVLLLNTDCIIESKNMKGERYEIENLIKSLSSAPDSSAKDILEHIIRDFYEFIGDTSLRDDLTTIVLKRQTKPS